MTRAGVVELYDKIVTAVSMIKRWVILDDLPQYRCLLTQVVKGLEDGLSDVACISREELLPDPDVKGKVLRYERSVFIHNLKCVPLIIEN